MLLIDRIFGSSCFTFPVNTPIVQIYGRQYTAYEFSVKKIENKIKEIFKFLRTCHVKGKFIYIFNRDIDSFPAPSLHRYRIYGNFGDFKKTVCSYVYRSKKQLREEIGYRLLSDGKTYDAMKVLFKNLQINIFRIEK